MQTIHPLNQVRRLCSIGLVSLPVLSDAVFTQAKSASPADIYLYKEADREHRLMAGARKEDTVSIYTSLNRKKIRHQGSCGDQRECSADQRECDRRCTPVGRRECNARVRSPLGIFKDGIQQQCIAAVVLYVSASG
jgi:hypothetical protein